MILIYYYDKDKVELVSGSPATLHSSTSYNTTPTRYIYQFTPPAGARYFKVFLVGGYTDTNVAGTVRFDDVKYGEALDNDNRIMAGTISQSMLKTSTGEVSVLSDSGNFTLPGGQYGFYTQSKISAGTNHSAALVGAGFDAETYTTNIYLYSPNDVLYAQQCYISASGKDHWIFLLKDTATGRILASYQAPDHPSANSQALHTDIPHPFSSYKSDKHEIVLADNVVLEKLKRHLSRKRSLLTIINAACIIDDAKSAEYDYRLIRKINEFPDEPYGGDVITMMKTPQWAKIAIRAEEISIEQFAVEKLPEMIQYRKLYFDEKKL